MICPIYATVTVLSLTLLGDGRFLLDFRWIAGIYQRDFQRKIICMTYML